MPPGYFFSARTLFSARTFFSKRTCVHWLLNTQYFFECKRKLPESRKLTLSLKTAPFLKGCERWVFPVFQKNPNEQKKYWISSEKEQKKDPGGEQYTKRTKNIYPLLLLLLLLLSRTKRTRVQHWNFSRAHRNSKALQWFQKLFSKEILWIPWNPWRILWIPGESFAFHRASDELL